MALSARLLSTRLPKVALLSVSLLLGAVAEAATCDPQPLAPAGRSLDPAAQQILDFADAMVLADIPQWRREARRLQQRTMASDACGAEFFALGLTYLALGRAEAAVDALQQALRSAADPARAPAALYLHLGFALRETGRAAEAQQALQQALQGHQEAVAAQRLLGHLHREGGRLQLAVQHYRQAWRGMHRNGGPEEAALLMQWVPTRVQCGIACTEVGAGLDASQRLVDLHAEDARVWLWHGLLLGAVAADGAGPALREAARLAEQDAALLVAIGRGQMSLGDWAAARDAFELAIALDPQFAEPHEALGDLWSERGRIGWALDAWHQAALLDQARAEIIARRVDDLEPGLGQRFRQRSLRR